MTIGIKGFQKGHPYHKGNTGKYIRTEKSRFNSAKNGWKKGMEPYRVYDERHGGWKGDNVGRNALHRWVEKRLGKPTTCEHCGKTGLTK